MFIEQIHDGEVVHTITILINSLEAEKPMAIELPFLISSAIALIWMAIGSATDLRTREVPDWLNYSLIVIGFAAHALFSIVYTSWLFILQSAAGFALFFLLGAVMFYTGQWGGGDAKMVMGLGALIGLDLSFTAFPFILSFLINILLVGALYGLLFTIYLSLRNWAKLIDALRIDFRNAQLGKMHGTMWLGILALLLAFLATRNMTLGLAALILCVFMLTFFYLWVYIRAVEKACMIKEITPDRLTEGDWIAKEVRVGNKVLACPKDLGIDKKQIGELNKLYKKRRLNTVWIKEGIPFVPTFFLAYVVTLFVGNIFSLLI